MADNGFHVQPLGVMSANGHPAPFDDLMKTEPTDTAAVEVLQLKHCAICRQTQGQTPSERMLPCADQHCRLRDPERLAEEREWLRYITEILWFPNTAPQEAVDLFNRYLVATQTPRIPILGTYASGRRGLFIYNRTLRAAVQQSLLLILARHAGDRQVNVAADTQREVRDFVSESRREYIDDLKRLVTDLRGLERPVPWAKIHAVLGPDAPSVDTLKDWHNEVKGLPARGRRQGKGSKGG